MSYVPANRSRSVLKNVVSQVGGRLFLSASRFGLAVILIRLAGPEQFGQYALLMSLLLAAEWLVDFGLTDIAIRNVCQQPARELALTSAHAAAKMIQSVVAYAVFMGVLVALGYPAEMIAAGAVGGIGIFCYAGILMARSVFRLQMSLERDVMGEIVGVLIMIPLTWIAAARGASIVALVAIYTLSRIIFLAINLAVARKSLKFTHDWNWRDIRELFWAATPLGFVGMLIACYDSLAPVMLSKMVGIQAVAEFFAALRFILPVFTIIQAIGTTMYTLLASYWKSSPDEFHQAQRDALEYSMLIGAACFCVISVGAEFWMQIMDPTMVAAAALVLRPLSLIILSRTITTILAPIVTIAGGQKKAMWMTLFVICCKIVALFILIPRYGIQGAVWGYVSVEFAAGALPFMLFSRTLIGYSIRWTGVLKIGACAVTTLGLASLTGFLGSIWAALLAPLVLIALAIAIGAVDLRKIRSFSRGVRGRIVVSSGV